MPSEFTAASLDRRAPEGPGSPSGQGSGPVGSRSNVSPNAMSGCGRMHPGPGGIVPAAIATAALTRLAMPAAALA